MTFFDILFFKGLKLLSLLKRVNDEGENVMAFPHTCYLAIQLEAPTKTG